MSKPDTKAPTKWEELEVGDVFVYVFEDNNSVGKFIGIISKTNHTTLEYDDIKKISGNSELGSEVELTFGDNTQMEDFIFKEFLFKADTYPNQLVRHCPEYVI